MIYVQKGKKGGGGGVEWGWGVGGGGYRVLVSCFLPAAFLPLYISLGLPLSRAKEKTTDRFK